METTRVWGSGGGKGPEVTHCERSLYLLLNELSIQCVQPVASTMHQRYVDEEEVIKRAKAMPNGTVLHSFSNLLCQQTLQNIPSTNVG